MNGFFSTEVCVTIPVYLLCFMIKVKTVFILEYQNHYVRVFTP